MADAVRLPEADDQSGGGDPEPVPILLRAQTLQEESPIADEGARQRR